MAKQINLAYGRDELSLDLAVNYSILESSIVEKCEVNWEKKIKDSFSNPINSPSLYDIVKDEKPEKVVIIINDITRPVPYEIVLKPMLEELEEARVADENISLLIATGMHRPMTKREVEDTVGREIMSRYHWENHKSEEKMAYFGRLSEGIPLYVNPLIREADLVCAVGVIAPHYMAGYSGGRKSLLPGVCGRKTIEAHHSLMRLPESKTANLTGNRFHLTAVEAAQISNLKFISNVVVDSKNKAVDLVVGHFLKAWEKGVELCRKNSVIKIDQLADGVIVSVGGFPKDINMYQAQKALENASYCVKEGTPILLIAECEESLGEEVFEQWLLTAEKPEILEEKIKDNFELGGHKAFAIARVAKKHPIYLYSNMEEELVHSAFMEPVAEINNFVNNLFSDKELVYIMPHGANTVPSYFG